MDEPQAELGDPSLDPQDEIVDLDVRTSSEAVTPEVDDARLATAAIGDALVVPDGRPLPPGWAELPDQPVRPGGRWVVRER